MPVVNLSKSRLEQLLPEVPLDRLLEALPFIGLDIEGEDETAIRVEYNPNRPDYSSQYGIVRALKGILEIDLTMPKMGLAGASGISIKVDPATRSLRPFVAALAATGGRLDDDNIKQLIAMQEDLHNGLGRRRRKASIGIHNLDKIKPPVYYKVVNGQYSFVPLGESRRMSILDILSETEAGRLYALLVSGWKEKDSFPVITDSSGVLLSFPPIINGVETEVNVTCRNLFVEVTTTSKETANDVLAVIAMTLIDAGFQIKTVKIFDKSEVETTPAFPVKKLSTTPGFLNNVLGTSVTPRSILLCLKKCRLGAAVQGKRIVCTVPRYRSDIQSEIDLAEEFSIGYGIQKLDPTLPTFFSAGSRSLQSRRFESVRSTLVGMEMIENLGFSLTSHAAGENPSADRPEYEGRISVESSKSAEHVVLRDSLVPSLLQALSRNIHELYPQRLFEIGKVFMLGEGNQIVEKWVVSAALCHADASFTEALSSVSSLLELSLGITGVASRRPDRNSVESPRFSAVDGGLLIQGRSAEIVAGGRTIGFLGEIAPASLESIRLRMPVSVFEIDLTALQVTQERTNSQ